MKNLPESIKPDAWLAQFFGRDAYRLTLDEKNLEEYRNPDSDSSAGLKHLQGKKVFIYSKIPAGDLGAAALLENRGFHLIDTLVVFEKPLDPRREYAGKCRVRAAEEKDRAAVVELAGRSFVYSRFHIDPEIPVKTANEIKSAWVGNYFNGKRGDAMFVAELSGKVAGFILLIEVDNDLLAIDEIAVDAGARRCGIATDLMAHSEKNYFGRARFTAGTQVVNLPSTRFYIKNGFFISESHYVFHYHNV
ncbi:MAG: GNAT family N-acetyltransferase [bacterium]